MSQVSSETGGIKLSAEERQVAIGRLIGEISQTNDLGQILERSLKIITETTGAEVGEIFLVDNNLEEPEIRPVLRQMALRVAADYVAAFSRTTVFEYGEGFPGLVAQMHSSIFTNDLASDPRFLRPEVKRLGFVSTLATPLIINRQVIGSVGLYSKAKDWLQNEETLHFVELLVQSLALAVGNVLNEQKMKQSRAGMKALSTAVEILNTSLNPRHVLVRLLSEAVKLMGANGGAVYLYTAGEEYFQPTATILIDPEWRERGIPVSGSLAAEVLLTGTVRTVADTAQTPEKIYPLLEDWGRPGSMVAAPLIRRGQVRGVLECYKAQPHNFSGEQIELLAALASHATLALRNAELHQEIATERHQADVERKKLRAILENSPEGLFFVQPNGQVVDMNQSARDILRWHNIPDNFFQFERPYQIFQPDCTARVYEDIPIVKALQEQAITLLQESILRWPDGVEKHLLLSAKPIYDEREKLMGAVTVFQDVTKLKEADKLKAKFLSMITHELKTPLASIKGTVSGLLQEDVEWDEASQKRFLHSIEDDVDGMVALVANLLDMARLEAGFMTPELEECYLSEVAEEAARKLRGLANAAQQKLEFDFAPTTPPVAADFLQLERVMVNLVGNALKYSPNGTTVKISVYPTQDEAEKTMVEVAIADRGPGIAAEEREEIFKQFYRGKQVAGRTGRKVGTGLGLAICREIITMHGGSIWVEQREGGGSVFKFRLPVLES